MNSVTLPAYAKLNLTLDILRKRPDGYHDLRMVMQSIALHDDVTVSLAQGEGIRCHCGAGLPEDENNLAVKAALAFFAQSGVAPRALEIDITKRIPACAGMAGGSTDAAATLRALRTMLCPEMADEVLERIGAAVGSDVPYCIRGGTALAEGRGEILTTLKSAPRLFALVCKPDFAISTPALYGRVRVDELHDRPDTDGMLRAIARGDADGVIARVGNVFEQVLPEEFSQVFAIKRAMLAAGAETAAMTGSGPTVFGLFRDKAAAEAARSAVAFPGAQVFLTEFV